MFARYGRSHYFGIRPQTDSKSFRETIATMIAATYPLSQMLTDIGVLSPLPLTALGDSEGKTASQLRLKLTGQTPRAAVFVEAQQLLQRRFAYLSPVRLYNELLAPLQRALGNGYKWGNQADTRKSLTLELFISDRGAVCKVQDQGVGFDFCAVLQALEDGQHYFHNKGKGFAQFAAAESQISFADGGRTCLLRFIAKPAPRDLSAVGLPGNITYMEKRLATATLNKALIGNMGELRIELAHIYQPPYKDDDAPVLHYLLAWPTSDAQQSPEKQHRTVIGRRAEEGLAWDFAISEQLEQSDFARQSSLRFPQPLIYFEDLELALYGFTPEKNLRKYLTEVEDVAELVAILHTVGKGIRALHDCRPPLPVKNQPLPLADIHLGALHRLAAQLNAQPIANPTFAQESHPNFQFQGSRSNVSTPAKRFQQLMQAAHHRIEHCVSTPDVFSHGLLSWINICMAAEHWYLCHFNCSQYAHPGYDLGHLLADLWRFCALRSPARHSWLAAGQKALFSGYFGNTEAPWVDDLPYFTTLALLYRLDRLHSNSPNRTYQQLEPYLDLCEEVLSTISTKYLV